MTMVGMSSAIPFMPIYVVELGITDPAEAKLWSGFVFSGPYFFAIIASPIWGTLGDKYGRKFMIIRAVIGLSFAVFLMAFVQNVWQLMGLRLFQGMVSGMVAASLAFVSANTPEDRSGFAIGILQGMLAAGQIIGPLMGGVISDFIGIRYVFFIVSAFCFMSGVFVLFFVKETKKTNKNQGIRILSNIKYIAGHKTLLKIIILIIICQAGFQFTNPIFPFFVESKGAPQEYISSITGILIGTVGFFSAIFAPKWGRRSDKKDFHKTVRIASIIIGTAILLHIFMPVYYYLLPLRVIIGIFFAAMIPTLFSALSKRAPVENRGGLMGLASSATLLGSMSSFLLCGVVSSNFGMNSAFILAATLLFVGSLIAVKRDDEVIQNT
jgi:DHA1 family multidrug resistance protein-like MFS transporter